MTILFFDFDFLPILNFISQQTVARQQERAPGRVLMTAIAMSAV